MDYDLRVFYYLISIIVIECFFYLFCSNDFKVICIILCNEGNVFLMIFKFFGICLGGKCCKLCCFIKCYFLKIVCMMGL